MIFSNTKTIDCMRPLQVRVVPLTLEFLSNHAHLAEQGDAALDKGGDCSLQAMEEECFTSERCARGGPGSRLIDLALGTGGMVAVTAPDDGFAGCGKVTRTTNAFPTLPEDACILWTLCVAPRCRGMRVGREMVQRARIEAGTGPLFVFIDLSGLSHSDATVRGVFERRVARLRTTYQRLGFALWKGRGADSKTLEAWWMPSTLTRPLEHLKKK